MLMPASGGVKRDRGIFFKILTLDDAGTLARRRTGASAPPTSAASSCRSMTALGDEMAGRAEFAHMDSCLHAGSNRSGFCSGGKGQLSGRNELKGRTRSGGLKTDTQAVSFAPSHAGAPACLCGIKA